jgi:hypothetical protein
MNNKAMGSGGKVEAYDFSDDFKGLSALEREEILENAKHLLKLQKENALFADADVPPNEAEKGLYQITAGRKK